jgi:gliding motility-associated-like protein
MKKALLLLCVLFASTSLFAQEESSWWIFGDGAGIEFTPNPQNRSNDPAVVNSGYDTDEGVAAISDDQGDLMFFTDGSTVWNKNGQVMPNGTNLDGNFSSTQSAIIVKAPATPGVYFIFTVGAGGSGPLSYSRVEMALNGGLGDVVSGVKNVTLLQSCAEKVAATIQTGTTNAYVMTFAESNATNVANGSGNFNALFSWEVRGIAAAGVSFVLPSPIPQSGNSNLPWYSAAASSNSGDRGMLRVSPDGTKLALCNQNGGFGAGSNTGVWLYDFNPANGQFGGAGLQLDTGEAYGAEFSPSSQYLYHDISGSYGFNGNKRIVQYDLCDPNNILATRNEFANVSEGRSTLQMARDGNIYVARFDQTELGRIDGLESPTPVYNTAAIDISPGVSKQGLPVFVQSSFQSFFTVNDQCEGDPTEFILACLPQVAQSTWDFGDGNTLNVTGAGTVTNTYAAAGTYTVSVNVTNVSGDVRNFTQDITIYENGIVDPIDQTLLNYCDADGSGNELIDLTIFTADVLGSQDAASFDITYHLTDTDADNNVNPISTNFNASLGTNTVWVRIANNTSPIDDACSAIGSFVITVSSIPTATLADIEVCDDEIADGLTEFDLSDLANDVANAAGNPVDTDYTFYLSQADADSETNPLDTNTPFSNTTNPQTVYVRLQNNNDVDCYSVSPVNLVVLDVPSIGTADDITECDDAPIDGTSVFDLSVQTTTILNGQSATAYDVTYHTSNDDAAAGLNALNETAASIANGATIFARITDNNTGCFNISTFTAIVEICEVEIPEGFSPNNDGINDTFEIPGLVEQFDSFVLKIYNRHGVEIYETTANNYVEFAGIPNKGIMAGDGLLPVGTYYYVLQFNDPEFEDVASWLYINY